MQKIYEANRTIYMYIILKSRLSTHIYASSRRDFFSPYIFVVEISYGFPRWAFGAWHPFFHKVLTIHFICKFLFAAVVFLLILVAVVVVIFIIVVIVVVVVVVIVVVVVANYAISHCPITVFTAKKNNKRVIPQLGISCTYCWASQV